MKLHRPYVPMSVRVLVASQQMEAADMATLACRYWELKSDRARLRAMLYALFGTNKVHLDHDPPLMLRQKRNGGYVPPANDPDYLVYRSADDHRIKTFVRGDGAQRSDMGQRRYLKRVIANRNPKRKKHKISQRKRAWPKRKMKGKML